MFLLFYLTNSKSSKLDIHVQSIYCRYGGVGIEMIAPKRITLLFPYKNIRNNEKKKKLDLSQFLFDLI